MTELQLTQLKNNDGLTLKNYKQVNYKTGYQVATEGHKTKSAKKALKLIKNYKGDCGIWKNNNIYYIDKSYRIATKKQALALGIEKKQKSIYNWNKKNLIWC